MIKIQPITIKNFAKVDDSLFRGAAPMLRQFQELKANGFTCIINLRSRDKSLMEMEYQLCKRFGMKYRNFQFDIFRESNENIYSTADTVLEFINISKTQGDRIFIHCKSGKNRTGLLAGLYEQMNKIKSPQETVSGLFEHGYDEKKYPKVMKVLHFMF